VCAGDGDNNDTADHCEGERQGEDEVFHGRLPVQQVMQATACVLETAETATAPPITARASAKATTSVFISVLSNRSRDLR